MKIITFLLVGIIVLASVSATLYTIDVQSKEKVNFLTTDMFCEKMGIEKYTLKDKVSVLSPCYKNVSTDGANIKLIKTKEGEMIYQID